MRAGHEAARETFLARVLAKALGDAEEGVPTWAEIRNVRTDEPSAHGGENVDAEVWPDLVPEWLEVTPLTIADGYNVLRKVETIPATTRNRLLSARAHNDAGRLSGLECDLLVQLGLFGSVIFA